MDEKRGRNERVGDELRRGEPALLSVEEAYAEECPYCGTSLSEARKSGLVGCAHCYREMWSGLFPLVKKMQGDRAHGGKTPPVDLEEDLPQVDRVKAIARARYLRQKTELKIIIEHLHAEGNREDAQGYEEKLAAMEKSEKVEEDFVWRLR